MKGFYYQDMNYYPLYPVNLGAAVQKWRRIARGAELTQDEKRKYGEAVGEAIRKLQRTELQRCLTPTPSLEYRYVHRPTYNPFAPYPQPNPFGMVGDPVLRRRVDRRATEIALYEHAMALCGKVPSAEATAQG